MSRTSLVHYIAPSAISITPNANGSENDIAVYVARGTRIKVLAPKVGIGYSDSSFMQWSFSGRNRRLADSGLPYTIYARLSKTSQWNGYLVFAPKQKTGADWSDKYAYVTRDGLARPAGSIVSEDYWYIRLGEVSLPVEGKRTITLDTGVLGTDQYNTEWVENADALPLRVELGCTIDDEDAGQTPYVPWHKSLLLTAILMKGWNSVDSERFHHWEILRNTADAAGDAKWPSAERQAEFGKTGTFMLNHPRGEDDDFNGAMSAVFTIKAWGTPETAPGTSAPTEYAVMASTSITILAEAVEKYELALSSSVVNYSPQTDEYNPKEGVKVRIRAIDQRGDVTEISVAQLKRERLAVGFAPVDNNVWSPLTFGGGDSDVAEAVIGTAAFLGQKSLNVQLTRPIGAFATEGNEAVAELARTTIAFVRDGEDSREREWIFLRSKTAVTFGEDATSGHPLPALISGGEVKPKGAASGNDTNKNQDGWVPQGWWDEQHGVDSEWCYEYGAFRDFLRDDTASGSEASGSGHWGDFSTPRIWNHFGTDGGRPVSRYQWSRDAKNPPHYDADSQDPGADWQIDVPNRPEGQGWYLWTISAIKNSDGTYGRWGDPVRMTGDEGAPGTKIQRIYFKSNSDVPPERPEGDVTSDLDKPGAWRRVALSADEDNRYVYICERISEDNGETWNAWGNVVLFCYRPSHGEIEDMILNFGSKYFARKDIDEKIGSLWTFVKGFLFGKGNKGIDAEGNATLGNINADNITADSVTSKGYTGSDILSDKGFKMWVDKDGRSHVITDFFTARVKSFFASLEVKKIEHSRGNRIESPAGNTISRVDAYRLRDSFEDPHSEYIKINDRFRAKTYWHKMIHRAGRFFGIVEHDNHPVAFYRCYFTAEDEEKGVTNDWRVGDQAFCQTFNLRRFKIDGTAYGVTNKRYWRLVIGTGYEIIDSVEHGYIDLCNKPAWKIEEKGKTYHCIGYEDIPDIGIPAAGDDVAAFGSQTHPDTRGGALQYITCGENETSGIPCTRMFAGINGFDLSRHLIKESSPKREMVRADKFEILSAAGTGEYSSITCFRGDWVRGRLYGHYDVVQYFGSSWLCIVPKGTTTTEEPSKASAAWIPFAQRGGNPPAIVSDLGSVVMITDSRGAAMSAEVTMPERFSVVVDGSAVPVALWNKARCFVKYRNITARLDGTFEAPQQPQSGFRVQKLQTNENDVSIFWSALYFSGQSGVENPTDIVLHAEFTYKGETMTAEKSIPVIEQRTPASVLAEYSVTGEDNTWHSTFENGDIFAHYSYDGGNTWTPKIRIVGKSLEFKPAHRHFATWSDYRRGRGVVTKKTTFLVDSNENGVQSSFVVVYRTEILAQGLPIYEKVMIAEAGTNYLAEFDGHLYSSNGANKEWSDIGQIQGENGHDGMSFVLSPASVIFEQDENTLAIDTSAFKAQVIGMSGSRRLSVGSEYRVSIHDAVHCEATVTGNEVRITSIGKDANENYYSVGKVDVKVKVGSQPIILTLNWAANLLGTWKQTVKNDVMKMVSEKTVTTYDENGNLVTIPFGSVFEQASGHMILTVQGLYGTTGISVTDGTIDLSGKKIIIRNGDAPTAIFEDGKIKANLIDAEKIWADYIAGGNATFTGKVEAKAGYIGGFEIKDGALQAGSDYMGLKLSRYGIIFRSNQGGAYSSYVDMGGQNIAFVVGFGDSPEFDCIGIALSVPASSRGKTGTAIAASKGCYEGFRRRCVNAHESMEVGSETGVVRSYANNITLTLPTGIDDGQELIVIPVKSCKVRCLGNAKIVSGNGRREQQVDVTTRTIFIYDKENNLWDRMRFME